MITTLCPTCGGTVRMERVSADGFDYAFFQGTPDPDGPPICECRHSRAEFTRLSERCAITATAAVAT